MKVLVIAPHPDDEVLGCGATLKRFSEEGHDIRLLILTNRIFPNSEGGLNRIDPVRAQKETEEVCKILGIREWFIAGMTDTELPERLKELIALFEAERDTFKPDLVLVPDDNDTHQDHRVVHEAAKIVWRPHHAAKTGTELWSYQAPSSYGFVPNQFVAVTPEQIEAKVKALECYTTEVLPAPSTRCREFIESQAVMWGGVTQVERAEPFRHIMGVL